MYRATLSLLLVALIGCDQSPKNKAPASARELSREEKNLKAFSSELFLRYHAMQAGKRMQCTFDELSKSAGKSDSAEANAVLVQMATKAKVLCRGYGSAVLALGEIAMEYPKVDA